MRRFVFSLCVMVCVCFALPKGYAQTGSVNRTPDSNRASVIITQIDASRIQHLLNRITFGVRPYDVTYVQSVGVDAFIKQQLNPNTIAESPALMRKLSAFKTLGMQPQTSFWLYSLQSPRNKISKTASTEEQRKHRRKINKEARKVAVEMTQAKLMRAVESNRQLQEVMTDFWFNHFNVYAKKGNGKIWTGSYEHHAIRPHALGRFRDLLGATAKHPAMMVYLDNWQNTAEESKGARGRFKGINENYARELLELHTLGVDGGYTQRDVEQLARVLTGWGISPAVMGQKEQRLRNNSTQQFLSQQNQNYPHFAPFRHDYGNKVVLGRTIRGRGATEVEEVLDMLAAHPSTATHLSYKLAQYFVSDIPSPELVAQLSQVYMNTGGDIRSVLYALFTSDAFWAQENRHVKFKTPYQYVVSSVRSTGLTPQNYTPLMMTLNDMGMPLYGHITPDGYKNTTGAWMDPGAMVKRVSFATVLGGSHIKLVDSKNQVKKVDAGMVLKSYAPQLSAKTKQYVETSTPHLKSSLLLGSPESMMR